MLSYLCLLIAIFVTSVTSQDPVQYTVQEEEQPMEWLGNITRDANLQIPADNSIYFTILSIESGYQTLFTVGKYGDFRTASAIDRDAICPQMELCEIKLDVQVNPERYFQIVKVTVIINDINDEKPEFENSEYTLALSEASILGTPVSLPTAVDLDSPVNGLTDYRVANLDSNIFEFLTENNEPVLKLISSLDREIDPSYQFILLATDNADQSNSASTTITISVLDINDNFPEFTKDVYEVNVDENIKANESIAQVNATDRDLADNAQVFYYLSSVSIATYNKIFSIDEVTGKLSTNGKLDYEQIKEATLTVIARNKEPTSPSSQAKILVRVQDINDVAPSIELKTNTGEDGVVSILENATVGTFVAHITVQDPDTGVGGVFRCNIEGSDFALVKIHDTDFKIVTNVLLDREVKSSFNVSIRCADNGEPSLSSSYNVPITVADVNDNTPYFTKHLYRVDLNEAEPPGQVILTVKASDNDTGDNSRVSYAIAPGASSSLAEKHFKVNSDNGEVRLLFPLNYETTKVLSFNISASDHGDLPKIAFATIEINISDSDDEEPIFTKSLYTMEVFENNQIGVSIGQVEATDRDSSLYNSVAYGFMQNISGSVFLSDMSDSEGKFLIDPFDGTVKVNTSLDREITSNYTFSVIAIGPPPLNHTSTCEILIEVKDVNDNSPVIIYPTPENNTIYVPKVIYPESNIVNIEAFDPDEDENGHINYHIVSGDKLNLLEIDKETGLISSVKYHSFQEDFEVRLLILVTDNGLQQKSNSVYLNIVFNVEGPTNESVKTAQNKNSHILIIIGVLSGVIVVILLIAIACLLRRRKGSTSKPKHTVIKTVTEGVPPPRPPKYQKSHRDPGYQFDIYQGREIPYVTHSGVVNEGLDVEFDEVVLQKPDLQSELPPLDAPDSHEEVRHKDSGSEASNADSGHGSNEETTSIPGNLQRWDNMQLTAAVSRQESQKLQSSQSFRSDSTTPPELPPRSKRPYHSFRLSGLTSAPLFGEDPRISGDYDGLESHNINRPSDYTDSSDLYRDYPVIRPNEGADFLYDHPRYLHSQDRNRDGDMHLNSETVLQPPPPYNKGFLDLVDYPYPEYRTHGAMLNMPSNSDGASSGLNQNFHDNMLLFGEDDVFTSGHRPIGGQPKSVKYCSQV